jgi:uncharacterized protein (TIGR03382 family)
MSSRTIGRVVLLALVAGALVPSAGEAEVIVGYAGGSGTFQGGMVAGSTFNAPSGATFNSLGFIDVGLDGLQDSYQVGLWDTNSHALLASAIVTPSSPLINGFRYAAIPQTTLLPGTTFTVGALLHTQQLDAWVTNAAVVDGSGFTGPGFGRFLGNNLSLAFPSSPDGVTYVVANASDVVVPAPATLGLAGVGGLLVLRRRR